MRPIQRATLGVIEQRGWRPGTTLENQIALILSRMGWKPDEVVQQHRAGRFRLDFAWPKQRVCVEADGWHHRSPEGAARDAERDSWLRSEGWLVFRVDDRYGEESMTIQLAHVGRLIRHLIADKGWPFR